jgi:Putative prokaryotic signal transducing protein
MRWVTVAIFTLPTELVVIKGRLEAEGIKCFAKDELITQTINFHSQAYGGVKLQVPEDQVQLAHKILQDFGHIPYVEHGLPRYVKWLDEKTLSIPILSKIRIEARLMVLLSFLVATPLLIFYYQGYTKNPKHSALYLSELLTESTWCVQHVLYKDISMPLEASGGTIFATTNCPSSIYFGDNGVMTLPGLNSNQVVAYWNVVHDSLVISSSDTFGYLFNHRFLIEVQDDNLTLRSTSTTIHGNNISLSWR